MAAPAAPTTGCADLERWYREQLRPRVARAVHRGVVRPDRAAALEAAMTALFAGRRERSA
jgi:hypothetical protein